MLVKSIFRLLLCLLPIAGMAQIDQDSLYIREHYTKIERYIPMRDGVRLFASIYIPKDESQQYPILMNRTPYSVGPYGESEMKTSLGPNMGLAREGYIFVYEDVRGRYMSEGEFMDVRPYNPDKKTPKDADENSDTYDTIDWLLANIKNNNGRVGVWGISYPGFYSTITLPSAHPALKAVSPQAPVTDWFLGDDFHHKGVFFLMDAFGFYSGFGLPRPKPTTEHAPSFDYKMSDNYRFYLEMGPLKNANAKYLKNNIHFWNDLMSHPTLDAFWKARNIRPHLTGIKPAVLVVGGLFDAEDCYGAWETYRAIEKQNPANVSNRLVMGPWSHGGWARTDGDFLGDVSFGAKTSFFYRENIESRFFNFYLKDKGKMDIAEASVFETGSNQWRFYDAWPPKNSVDKKLYLQASGGVGFDAPKQAAAYDEYVSDPAKPVPYTEDVHLHRTREYMTDDQRFASRRPDVLAYQTDVLQEDITLAGPLLADLFVSTTGTDADFVVKLIDVFPDDAVSDKDHPSEVPMGGYQMLVRGEIMRGKFRKSFEKPEAFVPGKVSEVKFSLPDVSHCFKKGHRLMVQVQSSWFPLADRNPQTFTDIYKASEKDFHKATQRIFHDAKHPSHIEVKVMR